MVVNFLNEQNKGVLGVYENDNDPCLIAGESAANLCSRLLRYQSEYDCTLGTIYVATARNIRSLFDPAWKRQKEHCFFILREAIQGARRRRDNIFLDDVKSVATSLGGDRGRPKDIKARRRSVDGLASKISGASLKAKQTGKHVESGTRSLSSRISELCRNAYTVWFYMLKPDLDHLSEAMKKRFRELGFRLPRQSKILKEAIDRGQKSAEKPRTRRP